MPKSVTILDSSQAARQRQRNLLERRKRVVGTVHHFHSVGKRHKHPAVSTPPQHWRQLSPPPPPHVVKQACLLVLQVAGTQDRLLCGVIDVSWLAFHLS